MSNTAPGVTVGNAAKIATDITRIALENNTDPAGILPLFEQALDGVVAAMTARTENTDPKPFDAGAALTTTLGATPVPSEPQAPAPLNAQPANVTPIQQGAPVTQPAAIPGVQDGDPQLEEAWQRFFADVNAGRFADEWYDNRVDKRNPKAPDFKHKTWKRPGESYNVGLYVTGRDNPSWVAGALAQAGVS